MDTSVGCPFNLDFSEEEMRISYSEVKESRLGSRYILDSFNVSLVQNLNLERTDVVF